MNLKAYSLHNDVLEGQQRGEQSTYDPPFAASTKARLALGQFRRFHLFRPLRTRN